MENNSSNKKKLKFKKIILTGAQGTGKTTLLNELSRVFEENNTKIPVVTEVVRELALKKGLPINEDGCDESQNNIFDSYYEIFSEKKSYLSDRGLTDVMAYTLDGYENENVSIDCIERIDKKFREFFKNPENIKDSLYIFFPIEFKLVYDGVRSINKFYQKRIDRLIKYYLKTCGIPEENIMYISGSVPERLKQVLDRVYE